MRMPPPERFESSFLMAMENESEVSVMMTPYPIKGDSFKHAVRWKSGGLSGLSKNQYMLRVHLNNATVYAITVRERQ